MTRVVIEVEQSGDGYTIYRNGSFDGKIIKKGGRFQWRNRLADRIDSPFTHGSETSLRRAFVQLGYRYEAESGGGQAAAQSIPRE